MIHYIKYGGLVAALLAVGALALGVTHQFAIEFSGLAWFVAYFALASWLYSLVDNVFLRKVDTLKKIQDNPIALALYLLSFAIILSACVLAA